MKAKTLFYCTECGNETPKWQGKCPACGAWNTIEERPAEKASKRTSSVNKGSSVGVALSMWTPKGSCGSPPVWANWTGYWAEAQ